MRIGSVLIAIILIIISAKTMNAQDQNKDLPDIYQILAKECPNTLQERSLTGFFIRGISVGDEQVDGIVTALHGVAGCDEIDAAARGVNTFSINNSINLQLVAVDIDRDVALLVLKESSTLFQGQDGLQSGDQVEPSESIYVVGHPYGRSDQVQTTMELRSQPLKRLQELVPFPETRQLLHIRSSPALTIDALDIQGTLVPGYSGAPIFNSQNQVIGVANGGLKEGTTEFVWAIPWWHICWTAVNNSLPAGSGSCPNSALTQARYEALEDDNPAEIFAFPQSSSIELPADMVRLEVIVSQGENRTVLEQPVFSDEQASYLLPIPPETNLTGAEITVRNQESEAQEVLATGQVSSDDSRLRSLDANYEFFVVEQAGSLILNVFPLSIPAAESSPFTIRGRIIDRETGGPVADAIVTASGYTGTIRSGVTDSTGYYVLAAIDPAHKGRFGTLTVEAEGYGGYVLNTQLGQIQLSDILLTPDTLVQPPGISLVIGGHVFNSETRAPIVGATVALDVNLGGFQARVVSGTTDNSGNYILPVNFPLLANQYGTLSIEVEGFQTYIFNTQLVSGPLPDIFLTPVATPISTPTPTETSTYTPTPVPTSTPSLSTAELCSYAIIVRDAVSEEGIRQATVQLTVGADLLDERTDSAGYARFQYACTYDGDTIRVRVQASGYESYDRNVSLLTGSSREFHLVATSASPVPGTMSPIPNGTEYCEFAFRILDQRDEYPIARATLYVTLGPEQTNGRTDSNGYYGSRIPCDNPSDARVAVRVMAEGYETYSETFPLVGEIREIQLSTHSTPTPTPTFTPTYTPVPPTNTPTPTIPTATPLAFPTASEDETLVLVANFVGTDDYASDPQEITRNVLENMEEVLKDYPDIRVERLPMPISQAFGSSESEKERARQFGSNYNASIIIWGSYINPRDPEELWVHYYLLRSGMIRFGADFPERLRFGPDAIHPAFDFKVNLGDFLGRLVAFSSALALDSANRYEEASRLYASAAEAIGEPLASEQASVVRYYQAVNFAYLDQLQQAEEAIDELLNFVDQTDALYPSILHTKGFLAYRRNDLEEALYWLQDAQHGKALVENHSGRAVTLSTIGWIYFASGDESRALDYFEQSLEIWLGLGNLEGARTTRGLIDYARESQLAPTPTHRPTPTETVVDSACVQNLLAAIPSEKTKQLTYDRHDQQLALTFQGDEEVLGPFGLTLTQDDVRIGALTFEIMPDWTTAENSRIRIISFLDAACNTVVYENQTRDGELLLFNYDTIGFRLGGQPLTLRFKTGRFEEGNNWIRFDFHPDSAQTVTATPIATFATAPISNLLLNMPTPVVLALYVQNLLGGNTYLIAGEGISAHSVGDSLVVYDEFVGVEVAIALLRVTTRNPNSLSAQVVLERSDRAILSGLRVDNNGVCLTNVQRDATCLQLSEGQIRYRSSEKFGL